MDPDHADISVRRQCELLAVNRSGLYYQPCGESAETLHPKRLIDEEYTRRPFYGSRRMRQWLQERGYRVGRHRVRRLMELLGLQAVYPKPRLSQAGEGHRIYPYLLRDVAITRVHRGLCLSRQQELLDSPGWTTNLFTNRGTKASPVAFSKTSGNTGMS